MLCNLCNKNGNFICSKCNNTYYCTQKCQKNDWINHKLTCHKKDHNIVIIDVGSSYYGNVSKEYRHLTQKKHPIIFIEPDTYAFNILQISPIDTKLNVAVAIYDGDIEFNHYQEGTHSILKTNLEEIHKYIDGYSGKSAKIEDWSPRNIVKVKCLRLDTIMKQNKIDKIDFLKIDTQGYDFNVIKSLGYRIKDVRYLECEVQITSFEVYLNSSKKNDIIEYMTKHNFRLDKEIKQTYDQEENLYFENINYEL